MPDLLVAPDDGIHPAGPRLGRQVHRELRERFLLAHLRRRDRPARLPGRGPAAGAEAVGRLHLRLGRSAAYLVETVGQGLELELVELLRYARQRVPQPARLQNAGDQVARAHLRVAEHQRPDDPAPLHGLLDLGREVRDRRRAARQPVETVGDVAREPRRVDVELLDDPVQIGILQLQYLMDPMDELDVRVPAHLAEHGRGLYGLVADLIELTE